ncbi:MAG: hypothetical protein QM601_08300 [Pseudoxanthomonas sp.]
MSKLHFAVATALAGAITALGVTACIWLAKVLVPPLLAHADSVWFLPTVLSLSVLPVFLLLVGRKRRAKS